VDHSLRSHKTKVRRKGGISEEGEVKEGRRSKEGGMSESSKTNVKSHHQVQLPYQC
jgi:hypothetical protein